MENERQKKLFDDIEVLTRFFDEGVITLSQYYEIKSKIVDNHLAKVVAENKKGGN